MTDIENEYSYETYPLDSWGDNDNYNDGVCDLDNIDDTVDTCWQPDYFTKINTILDNPLFDKSLPYNTFVKTYDIEESLEHYLINNIIYYYNKFKIDVNKDKITFGSLCLSNIPIDDKYSNYLKHYLDTINFEKEDIELMINIVII